MADDSPAPAEEAPQATSKEEAAIEDNPVVENSPTTAAENDAEGAQETDAPTDEAVAEPPPEKTDEAAPDAGTTEQPPAADALEPEVGEAPADVSAEAATETEPGTTEEGAADAEAAAPTDEGQATEEKTDQPADAETAAEADGAAADNGEAAAEGEAPSGAEGETAAATEGEEPRSDSQLPPADGEPTEPAADGEIEEKAEGEKAEEPMVDGEEGEQEKPEDGAVPQSDTFADGEKPESPAPHIGEVLSREGSPSASEKQKAEEEGRTFSPPVADSPRESQHEEHFDAEAFEEEIMSPEQDREALVEMYHAAISEREQLQQQNHQLQHKLAEYFKKKKSDEQKPEAADKNEADQEQRYLKYMSQLEELRAEDQQIRDEYATEIEDLKQRCEEKQHEVDTYRVQFVEFKHQVALNSLNSRSGKPIPPKDVEQYLGAENRKDQEVIAVRLENIKLKNKLKKKEQQLKSKEELADGLHLIDFEQLKIENQTYNEKIEERNEELLKLRKKITNTVQVLTHLKEKLQFVQGENSLLKNKLKDVEGAVAQKRDVLTRTKQARDALRIDNHRLRQNCGLLGNEPLLRDFEERKDEADGLKERLERLKMQHAELTLNTASVRRKIEQIKANEQP